MKREVFMLEHEGEILYRYPSYSTNEQAVDATKNPAILSFLMPTSVMKYFGKPGEYERAVAEFKPPTVVRFVEERV